MIRRVVLLVALLFCSPALGAVAIEGSGINWIDPTASPRTASINCGTNPNRVLYIFSASEALHTVSAITFAGNNVTDLLVDITDGSGTTTQLKVWRYMNPPTGSSTLSITWSLGDGGVMGGICFSGVDSGTPNSTPQTITGHTPNTLTVTVPANGIAVDFIDMTPEDQADITFAAGQTLQTSFIYDTARGYGGITTRTATGNFTISNFSTNPWMSHAAFAVNPVAAAPTTRRKPVFIQ